jgi:hypothetical protein
MATKNARIHFHYCQPKRSDEMPPTLHLPNIHVDFLQKDYLSVARQANINNPPSADPLGDYNMPRRRSKGAQTANKEIDLLRSNGAKI